MKRMTRNQAAEQVLSECFWGDYVLDAHTYDDACLTEAVKSIRKRFFPSIRELVEGMRAEAT
jgi:hypothetical protein